MFDKMRPMLGAIGLLLAACASSSAPSSSAPSPSGYRPSIDPANFSTTIDNRYLAFATGTTFVYEGTRDGQAQRDVVTITDKTKVIMGVTCVVVTDVATHDGALLEKTEDWYAQDRAGNVWYFGEATATYDAQGNVDSTEGSWQGGVDGAQPGIVMPASPQLTDSFRQEFYAGHAEDMFWVVSRDESVEVPFSAFQHALKNLEWTPLEPEVVDAKVYVAGVGLVLEQSVSGPEEKAELVSVTKP